MLQHAVDARHALAHVLKEEDDVFAPDVVAVQEIPLAAAADVGEHGHIAADDDAACRSLLVQRMGGDGVAGQLAHEHVAQHHVDVVVGTALTQGAAHVGVQAHHSAAHHGAVQGGNVAIAHDPLGMIFEVGMGHRVQEHGRAVAAAGTHDGLDGRVVECPAQVGAALLDGAGIGMALAEHVLADDGFKTPCAQCGSGLLGVVVARCAGGRDDSDLVAGLEGLGHHQGCCLVCPDRAVTAGFALSVCHDGRGGN